MTQKIAPDIPKNAIVVRGLQKVYAGTKKEPEKIALKGIDLDIPQGSMFALLGPNGAGKSTFINILAGTVNKTSGQVTVWGRDLDHETRDVKSCIGIVPQEITFDPFFTPHEMLKLQTGYFGFANEPYCDEILKRLGLEGKKKSRMRSLSGGMRRRMLVAKALVHSPPILILDEPTAGVDIELREQLWDFVRYLNTEYGVTVVLTTHYLQEAEEMCDTIAIIDHGELVVCDSKATLMKSMDIKTLVATVSENITDIPEALKTLDASLEKTPNGTQLHIHYAPSKVNVSNLMTMVLKTNLTITDMSIIEKDLSDIFTNIVNQV